MTAPEPTVDELLQEHYERLTRFIESKILGRLPGPIARRKQMSDADVAAIARWFREAHAIVEQGRERAA